MAIARIVRPARAAAFLLALAAVSSSCSSQPDFDLIIRGGTVYDGTGETVGVRRTDVGINGDRITAIGDLSARSAPDVIDATGKIVAPGFIDVQSRSGLSLLAGGLGESHVRQGITSEILTDNSPALWTTETADKAALERYGLTFDWRGLGGYFTKLESRGTAVNVGTMIPLSLARAAGNSAPFIDAAMRGGAFGVVDDVNADVQEVLAAATIVGRYDGVIMVRADSLIAASDDAVLSVGVQAHRIVIAGMAQAPADHPASEIVGRMLRAAPRGVFVYGTFEPRPATVGEPNASVREAAKFGGVLAVTDASAFGAFPRFLGQMVRDDHVVELREAVRRSTSVAASIFQIAQRGIIRETYFADIVVFDERAIADRATFEKPNQYPAGIEYVIVNGIVTVTPKGLTGSRPGSRLVHGLAAR